MGESEQVQEASLQISDDVINRGVQRILRNLER